MHGGEIFVPKIPSFKVTDVAKVVCPNVPTKEIGIRPGEKLHEVMITEDDSYNTYEFEKYFAVISPELKRLGIYERLGTKVEEGFRFSSDNNKIWHTQESFLKVLQENGIIT
jgi:UDP-N-acetylglucosamine 4,6-dehydratase